MEDFFYILQWWFPLLIIGLIFFPLASAIFETFSDRGYLFSKVIGVGLVSYTILILNIIQVLTFNNWTIFFVLAMFLLLNVFLVRKTKIKLKSFNWRVILFEEMLFLSGLTFWSYVRAHEPSINGLEKFMDFGFVNSILRTDFQPATDMWFTPHSINYYYFGHLSTAVLTKISLLPSYITYNLMIATLFSFTLGLGFSLGMNLFTKIFNRKGFITGILSGILLAFGGNLHTIYALFKPYDVEKPVSFFNLLFQPTTIPNQYWYPNATRFIPLTIHEFPIYSFIVSDLHGHVTDIMFVLLTIAMTYVVFIQEKIKIFNLVLIALFISIMYMTNAWDGVIYMLLFMFVLIIKYLPLLKHEKDKPFSISKIYLKQVKLYLTNISKSVGLVVLLFVIFSLPFSINFKPFAAGIGLLCSPSFLTDIGKVGPILFEADHCQRSPFWQLVILYGFFYFFVVSFLGFLFLVKKRTKEDLFVVALILVSTLLIIIPEIVYVRDIYPAHYRANTMFKLVYQAFMMLMVVSAYSIIRVITTTKNLVFCFFTMIFLIPVLFYPYIAIMSYYGELKTYKGLDGIDYLKTRLPEDYEAINFLNRNVQGKPVIVEAQGDSYTDYARISANTGLPTILGWTVHEWLWRGTYDIPAPRIAEVKDIYESPDLNRTKSLLKKYNAVYVYLGGLERQKYPNLIEDKFEKMGKVIFKVKDTKIYKLSIQ